MASRSIKFSAEFQEFDSWSELDDEGINLLQQAKEISGQAYAPYSKFLVGAAALLENGQIVTGNNQENAAYPSGLCAERVALFYAGSQYPGVAVKRLAIYAFGENYKQMDVVSPCGACRQVISEYEFIGDSEIEILMASEGKVVVANGIGSLLPFRFQLNK